MFDLHSALLVVIVAVVTLALRLTPFLVFGGKRQTPEYILYLGRVLPCAIMGMLVIYCLKGISFGAAGDWLPELISCALVAGLHVWRRNTLLSIISGTVCYMLLVQLVL